MATERLANNGYLALGRQSDPNTIVIPSKYVPFYSQSLTTVPNHVEDQPAYGHIFENFQIVRGQRSHNGGFTVMAEANTAANFFDMTLTRGTQQGTGPYTDTFTLSNTTKPSSYVVDISYGNVVSRFWGFQAGSISPDWNDNEMQLKVENGAAIGSFQGREIDSVSGVGPYTVKLKTNYDPRPTKGLVVGDLIRFFLVNNTTVDATVASVEANGTDFTTSANPTVASGDFVHLRPATPSFTLLEPFLWAKSEFRYGATAAAALTATHTPLEKGSGWEIVYGFEEESGAMRSGSFDPAALVRKLGRYNYTDKRFFDTPEQLAQFNEMDKVAVVARHFAGANNQYELRVTMNHMKVNNPVPPIEAGSVIYSEQNMLPSYDQPDGQGIDVKVVRAISTL